MLFIGLLTIVTITTISAVVLTILLDDFRKALMNFDRK